MGSRIKGIVVGRDTGAELVGGVHEGLTGTGYAAEEREPLPESEPIAEKAERAAEYREKRRGRTEAAETTASASLNVKPYVVGAGGLIEAASRSNRAVGKAHEPANNGGLDFGSVGERAEDADKPKEIAFFSEPKRVKKRTQRSIFIFQSAVCAAVCGVMLLSRLAAPQLYENLHLYFMRLFGC